MSDLEVLEQGVAKATREYRVATALVQEYRLKLRLAEQEMSDASSRVDEARYVLDNAIVEHYEVPYDDPATDRDREEFEKRYADRQAEITKVREERQRLNEEVEKAKAGQQARDITIEVDGKIVHPDVIRTNLGLKPSLP